MVLCTGGDGDVDGDGDVGGDVDGDGDGDGDGHCVSEQKSLRQGKKLR